MDGAPDHPASAGHDRHAGDHLAGPPRSRDRDRCRARGLADLLRFPAGAARQGAGARHRCRHPRAQPSGHRSAPDGGADRPDPGLVPRSRAARSGPGAGREGGRRCWWRSTRTTPTSMCSRSCGRTPRSSPGSYCVVFDTVIEDMPPGSFPDRPWGIGNSPKTAVREFLKTTDAFEIDASIQHKLLITVAPDGYLRRRTA